MHIPRSLAAITLVPVLAASLAAQVNYSEAGSIYEQNFDSETVLATGAQTWVNNETFVGWSASYYNGNTDVYTTPASVVVTTSSGTTFNLYRSTGSTDNALGGQVTDGSLMSGVGTGGLYYGVEIANTTGGLLDSLAFGYTGEQWRAAANTSQQGLTFAYSLDATSLIDTTATWTHVAAADFLGPITNSGTGAISVNGNLDANRVVFDSISLTGVLLAEGQSIWLRWFDDNSAFADHGFAVDDVWFSAQSAVPEPSAFAMLAGCAGLLSAVWNRRRHHGSRA